jgi:N-acetylneuraminate lyase
LFSGIIPALLTPFTPQGDVNLTALEDLVEFVLAGGVRGLYLCGSAGEGLLLSEAERRSVVETAVEQVDGRVPIIVHVGALATATSARLARHARETGADAVASIPPFYYPAGEEGIRAHYREIARAADLPLYAYNIPGLTNVDLGTELIEDLFQEGVIQGVKYTSYDQLDFRKLVETCGPELNLFSGPDEMLLPFLVMGGHGGIGTTYNCFPDLFVAIYDAWRAGDMPQAQQLQYQVDRFILLLRVYGVIPAVKVVTRWAGVDCGPPRMPIQPLTAEEEKQLHREVEQLGLLPHSDGKESS